jgi:hypothetical protein
MRTVKLDPTFCPAGSGAMVAGKVYTVEVGSVLSVPDSLSDEAVRAELGAMLLPGEAK